MRRLSVSSILFIALTSLSLLGCAAAAAVNDTCTGGNCVVTEPIHVASLSADSLRVNCLPVCGQDNDVTTIEQYVVGSGTCESFPLFGMCNSDAECAVYRPQPAACFASTCDLATHQCSHAEDDRLLHERRRLPGTRVLRRAVQLSAGGPGHHDDEAQRWRRPLRRGRPALPQARHRRLLATAVCLHAASSTAASTRTAPTRRTRSRATTCRCAPHTSRRSATTPACASA